MYLDLTLLHNLKNNHFYYQSSTSQESLSISKGYEIIEHAYDTIKNNDDELFLADAISNLRKAVNYRLSDIFNNLGINSLNIPLGKKNKLEKLESLGIVKPLLINKLLAIRNDIEYRGNTPPNKKECEELIDVVWYFYRSTDRYCSFKPEDWIVEWEEEGKECFMTIDFDLSHHMFLQLCCRCPEKYLSEIKTSSNFVPLKNVKIENGFKEDWMEKLNYHQHSFTAEIEPNKMPLYLELFSFTLEKWSIEC